MKTFRFVHAPIVTDRRKLAAALNRCKARFAVVEGGTPPWAVRWRKTKGRSYAAVVGRRGTAALERGCQKIDIKPDLFVAYEVTIVDGVMVAVIGVHSVTGLDKSAGDQLVDLIAELRERHPGVEFILGGLFYDRDGITLIREMLDYLDTSWINEGDAWVAFSDGLSIVDWKIEDLRIEVDLAHVR